MRKILFVSILLLASCGKATVQHPGAFNSFDNYAYDTLIVEQAALNRAKASISKFPGIKTSLNIAIDEYNTSMAAYKVYHLALQAGKNPDTTSLRGQIDDLIGKVAAILKATGVTQ